MNVSRILFMILASGALVLFDGYLVFSLKSTCKLL
jgi:hypothetical protein